MSGISLAAGKCSSRIPLSVGVGVRDSTSSTLAARYFNNACLGATGTNCGRPPAASGARLLTSPALGTVLLPQRRQASRPTRTLMYGTVPGPPYDSAAGRIDT